MNLYRFSLRIMGDERISKRVLEVEEKNKSYAVINDRYEKRVLKSEIGVSSGYNKTTVYLLEDDIEKAKSILVESLKAKIECEKQSVEGMIKLYNMRIAEYEKCIDELSEGEEG